jgi:formylglycine-generating enzyme required for sulfatase activity
MQKVDATGSKPNIQPLRPQDTAHIASLLASAHTNDSKPDGKAALASIREALLIDPQNAAALALQAKIRAYYDFQNTLHMKLAYIPAGRFIMGSPTGEKSRDDNEMQHEVTLTKSFYMAATDVTVGQFRKFVAETRYQTEAEIKGYSHERHGARDVGRSWRNSGLAQSEDDPVVHVDWKDSMKFCEWLSKKERTHYHLPTEAQWEYACRAGTTTALYAGDNPEQIDQAGWYSTNSHLSTHPVASKTPNAWGLYDMSGNVWQWCLDCYDVYPRQPQTDPIANRGDGRIATRGGSFYNPADLCRSARRNHFSPDWQINATGFRVAMDAS